MQTHDSPTCAAPDNLNGTAIVSLMEDQLVCGEFPKVPMYLKLCMRDTTPKDAQSGHVLLLQNMYEVTIMSQPNTKVETA